MSELFFDIETGGLSGHRSSIMSLSWARPGGLSEDYFAAPTPGTWVSRWAEGQVWEEVKKESLGTEQQLLEKFLNVLEETPAGTTLAGWNIGYSIQPQDIEGKSKGFDVPFLLTRAEAYGLRERYAAAIGKMHIRDIGQEYAVKLTSEIAQYPQFIEASLFEQAGGYLRDTRLVGTTEDIARRAVAMNRSFAGWKQELLHDVIFPDMAQKAHQSRYDVKAAIRLATHKGPIFKGPEDVQRYGKQALINKLIASSRRGGEKNKLENLIQIARAPVSAAGQILPSVEEDFLTQLRERVSQEGVEWSQIETGEGFRRGIGKVWKGAGARVKSAGLSTFAYNAFQFAKQHKVATGIGIGAAALWAIEPLSLFSGKDDQYNTIEGLPHGGEGQRMRRSMTPFGSGYQPYEITGNDSDYERRVKKRFKFFAESLPRYGSEVGTGHKRIIIPKKALSESDIVDVLGFVPVAIAIPEAGQVSQTSFRHPSALFHIHNFEDYWTMHEDRHAAATMLVKKWAMDRAKSINSSVVEPIKHFVAGIPHVIEEGVPGAYYYLKGRLFGAESMLERLQKELPVEYKKKIASFKEIQRDSLHEFRQTVRGITEKASNIFSGKGSTFNTIVGLPDTVEAEDSRHTLTDFGSSVNLGKAVNRAMNLFRGTTQKIAAHKGMLGKAVLGPEQKIAEEVLERVRAAQFAHRPSRLTATYWAPDPKAAARYAGAAGSGGFVSKVKAGPETFFTRQDFYTDIIKTIAGRDPNKKQKLLEQAQRYWRGVDPTQVKGAEYAQVEALLPGEVTAEKIWAVAPGRKGPRWHLEGLSSQGFSNEMNKLFTDFGSPVDLVKAANRAHNLYKKHFIQAFKKAGISTKGIEWTSLVDRGNSGEVAMNILAKREGKLLAGLTYAFERNAIDITQIEVGKGLPSGLGRELFASEAHTEVFRKIGYKTGTTITSPVANPIVGRWQMQAYGSKITQAPGVDPKDFASLEQAVINKQISHEAFPGGVFQGSLPQRPSIWERIGLLRKRGLSESGPEGPQRALARMQKMQETHQRAQIEASKNALRPGMRHRQKTGDIVR